MLKGWFRKTACAALMFSCAGAALADDGFTLKSDPKIAMILFGPRNDGGWTQAFETSRTQMESELGQKIQFVEQVPESASAIKPAVERFIARGANIVIGTAFGYSDTFKELAEKYPDVAFLNGSGTTNGHNLESFYGRSYETHYLCGMAAGAMSKNGKLGFVAANPFGVVNWTVNAYQMGAKQMNPNVTTTVIYTGAWNDPVKERAAAMALIDQGADVIGQHVDTPTPQIVAQERGVYATGHHRDLSQFAPKATLCSASWNLGSLPGARGEENHGRRLEAQPLRRLHEHGRGRWRYRFRPGRVACRSQGQDRSRTPGDSRRQAHLRRAAQGS